MPAAAAVRLLLAKVGRLWPTGSARARAAASTPHAQPEHGQSFYSKSHSSWASRDAHVESVLSVCGSRAAAARRRLQAAAANWLLAV